MRNTICGFAVLALGACVGAPTDTGGTGTGQVKDGLTLTSADDGLVSGQYVLDDVTIGFEAATVGELTAVRVVDGTGAEVMRVEMRGKDRDSFHLWHHGVAMDLERAPEEQAEVVAFMNSSEAQLLASLWREIENQDPTLRKLASVTALSNYSIHMDEVLGVFNGQVVGEDGEARHGTICFGSCGPGCFSVNNGWTYCFCHDNCCNHNGGWACYSWCYWEAMNWCWQ